MQKLFIYFTFLVLGIVSCDKSDPAPTSQSAYPGTYTGKYTSQSASPSPSQVNAVAVLTAESGGIKVTLTAGANAATFTANFTADNKLEIPTQLIFGVSTSGTGSLSNNDTELGLTLTPGNAP
ncbi:MAG: hypothetical protein KGS48_03645, partial [Bacteroidetes bacterium]|nr:hypothetical protein [Bacteroidota bacterium]